MYENGIDKSSKRKMLDPLQNSGLVLTIPRNAFLSRAKGIELSALGRLYLKAINGD